jgi:chromosome segregation ATPase
LNFNIDKYNCSYIIGPNGSGKSALFAALNIGLGGAGRSNERGKRINDYIKENEKYIFNKLGRVYKTMIDVYSVFIFQLLIN